MKELKNIIVLILVHQLYFCCSHVHKEWKNLNLEHIGYVKTICFKSASRMSNELSVFAGEFDVQAPTKITAKNEKN